jgi:hypothetical protein
MGSNAKFERERKEWGCLFIYFTLSPFPLPSRFLTRPSTRQEAPSHHSHHQHEDVELCQVLRRRIGVETIVRRLSENGLARSTAVHM